MSNEPIKRPVPIINAKTGEVRLSEPVQVYASRQAGAVPAHPMPTDDNTVTTADSSALHTSVTSEHPQVVPGNQEASATSATEAEPDGIETAVTETGFTTAGQKNGSAGKPKGHIESLEQFIEYVYGRKGQRVALKPKVEKLLAREPRLDDAALSRLLSLAAGDAVLAVPRQLLLLSLEIKGYPALRAALGYFVSIVMQRHPAFLYPGVQGALRNLPEALPAADALSKVGAFKPAGEDGKDSLKGSDLQALRRNAVHLFAIWMAINRGINMEELAALLFQVMWLPAAQDLPNDNARLRALTELEQPAGVGLACQRFRQQAIDSRTTQEQAFREVNTLRVRLADTEAQRDLAEVQRDALEAELQALRVSTAAEMGEQHRQREVERTHLQHDQEQLRGRVLRHLDESVEMLEVGLTALRNKTPRVEVMIERAEHVVDALRAETKNLREE